MKSKNGRNPGNLQGRLRSGACRPVAWAGPALWFGGSLATAAEPRDPKAAIRDILEDPDIQTELVPAPTADATPPAWQLDLHWPDWLGTPEGAGDLAQAVIWVIAAVLVVLLVATLLRHLHMHFASKQTVLTEREGPPGGAGGGLSLDEVERLAASGRYGEAVHELLILVIRRLTERASPARRPADALTSRELARTLDLEGDRAQALMDLVGTVELSHFGGRPIGEAAYRSCVAKVRVLMDPPAEAA